MTKVDSKKNLNEIDSILVLANKNYVVGNFYRARKLVHGIIGVAEISKQQNLKCLEILRLSTFDKWAFSIGFFCIGLSSAAAFLVAY
ncbi:MAG: hypothetical protein KC505_07095 [Myxococcales bacterium]|nr:hypothetical protein [Myxococcales bacterium]USN50625.1 MAG: hypothetical protein H6731_10240 [Myxococcales bacterium]